MEKLAAFLQRPRPNRSEGRRGFLPANSSQTVKDGKGPARGLSCLPPPVQEEALETFLCGMRGGEGESCRAQYQGSDKLFSGEAGKGEV